MVIFFKIAKNASSFREKGRMPLKQLNKKFVWSFHI